MSFCLQVNMESLMTLSLNVELLLIHVCVLFVVNSDRSCEQLHDETECADISDDTSQKKYTSVCDTFADKTDAFSESTRNVQ